ncbi:MAG: ATPase P [Verrucomicrobiaceae bacterium]|nr:MAG: ATPase P [Verrucomicrobiaceae bacterium]
MIDLDIPGLDAHAIKHLVLDYNGTLALNGNILPGVIEVLGMLAPVVEIHVITADTFGTAAQQLAGLPVTLTILPEHDQAEAKLEYVRRLGSDSVVAIGNGRNDRKMLEAAAIGIITIQKEGASLRALGRADVVTTNVLDALELLRYPKRLVATLRS